MKLLYITNGITGSGGLERVLSVKAAALAEDFQYEVHLLTLNETGKESFFKFSKKLYIHSIPVKGNPINYFLNYKRGIQSTVDEIKPDIISVCDDGLKGFFLPILIKSKAKWIYERHVSKLIELNVSNSKITAAKNKAKWFLMELLGKNFDKFIVLTEGNKKEWSSLGNLEVIPNPLPFNSDLISTLENKTVICVGKISYQKGQDLLLKAWEIVFKKYPEWQLHLYGTENLNFLNTSDLQNNVVQFPPVKNIENKYAESSVYVMSSRFEGFGMVLIEAMSFGLPCVSFDCDYGPGDIIKNGEDGFLVEKENSSELAEKLLKLMDDSALRKKMGSNAKKNSERFAPHIIVEQWDQLFKSLIG